MESVVLYGLYVFSILRIHLYDHYVFLFYQGSEYSTCSISGFSVLETVEILGIGFIQYSFHLNVRQLGFSTSGRNVVSI